MEWVTSKDVHYGKKSLSTQKKMIQEEFPQAEHLLHIKKDFNSEGNDLFSKIGEELKAVH